jgi:hypothetical protein
MVTDSDTLALVLMKAASHSAGLEKEALMNPMPWLRGAGSAIKGFGGKVFSRFGSKVPAAASHPPLLPGAGIASNVQAEMARMHAARGGSSAIPSAVPAAAKYPRFFNRTTPISGSYLPGFKRMGGWLDNQANKGWGMRALTSIPRRMLPGKGLMNTGTMAGYGYGISSGVANRNLENEFEAVGTNAAAQALIQQRQWAKEHWLQNAFSPLVSDETVAQHLAKRSRPVAQAYWNQTQSPDHFTNVLQGVKQNHKYPWTSFFG